MRGSKEILWAKTNQEMLLSWGLHQDKKKLKMQKHCDTACIFVAWSSQCWQNALIWFPKQSWISISTHYSALIITSPHLSNIFYTYCQCSIAQILNVCKIHRNYLCMSEMTMGYAVNVVLEKGHAAFPESFFLNHCLASSGDRIGRSMALEDD